jgi:hypothetical protein
MELKKSEIKVNWSLKARRSITIRECVGAYLMQDITLLYYYVAYGYIASWFIKLRLCVFIHRLFMLHWFIVAESDYFGNSKWDIG